LRPRFAGGANRRRDGRRARAVVSSRGRPWQRGLLAGVWAATVLVCLYGFFFHREAIRRELADVASISAVLAAALYLAVGCLRGFSLVPSTSLVLLGLPFFPPGRLFALTLVGIAVSSALIYRFAASMRLDEAMSRHPHPKLASMRALLERHALPVIVAWSFFPLAPTDAICYIAGAMRIGFWKCIAGVTAGEGAICGIYIFMGEAALRWIGWT
jgi:uncharacterized membrane protein YdjX (TVP38/TMEM64 family)